MKKTIFQIIMIGLKKGYNTPTLPENLLALHNSVLIRSLRITGGLSAILFITGQLEKLNLGIYYPFFLYLCFILNLLFGFYSMYISYHRIKHMYKVLKSEELDIHETPFSAFFRRLGGSSLWPAFA